MRRLVAPLFFIFFCTTIAWVILGSAVVARTNQQDTRLKQSVGQLWGTMQRQKAPTVYYLTKERKEYTETRDEKTVSRVYYETVTHPVNLETSDITADLELKHRKKGLLWYATYAVRFQGRYQLVNHAVEPRRLYYEFEFPTADGLYDDFLLTVDGVPINQIKPENGVITQAIDFEPEETKTVEVAYRSQGMDEWWYVFGGGVTHIRNFRLKLTTDFARINFLENSISPTIKTPRAGGWELTWQYVDLISGIQIGLEMPTKVNPGPFVSRVTFFAPVSLFLFLFLMFIITAINKIRIHPMNYFFVCAAFFSFHLLLAYLADHIDIHIALLISSSVSIFLVITYMRLVAGLRFALLETGLSQFIYLVLFSYTFFLQGYTGLAITVLCIVTLFVVMQLTGRVDWSHQLESGK